MANIHDDGKGYTNIMIQSKKGGELLSRLDKIEKYSVNTKMAVKLDGSMIENSVKWNLKREKFFEQIETESIRSHCLKFFNVSLIDSLIEVLKRVYYFKKFND